MISPSFSNLSNLVYLFLTNVSFSGLKKNSLFIFSIISFYVSKIEEEFPSCFQNVTRLTNVYLDKVRVSNSEPIPFPTQFCNMIFLQDFTSRNNNFSGLCENELNLLLYSYIGTIPIDLTRLERLKWLDVSYEPLLEGLWKEFIWSFFFFNK